MSASAQEIHRVRPRPVPQSVSESGSGPKPRWHQQTWVLALASSFLVWLSLAPPSFPFREFISSLESPSLLTWLAPIAPFLAWIAPVGWLLLVRQEQLTGKRPYLVLWGAGVVHWLLVMDGVRMAYWILYFGWLALAAYLAVYIVAFVGIARVAVHRLRVPLVIAAPVTWVGLELARGYLLTGFSMALLGHSQVAWTPVIQVADLFGAYAVSFVVMFVAAAIAELWPWQGWPSRWWPAAASIGLLAAVLAYGQYRLNEGESLQAASEREPLKAVLIQGSDDTVFDVPSSHFADVFRGYASQAITAADAHPDADVIVWPESMFMSVFPQYLLADDVTVPAWAGEMSQEEFAARTAALEENFALHTQSIARELHRTRPGHRQPREIAQIVGTATYAFQGEKEDRYNSALLVSPEGDVEGHYYKMHRVMFGEYIPLGDFFPWIYSLSPMSGGLTAGREAAVFEVADYTLAPSICFESTVPHLIRRQIVELKQRGTPPDMLVNVTNDGWFWGTGVLDLHFACAVFRAVEHRKPILVAANTGLSVAVDGNGRVLAQGGRRKQETLAVEVLPDGRHSLYTRWGDWPVAACLMFCVMVAGVGLAGPGGYLRRAKSTRENFSAD